MASYASSIEIGVSTLSQVCNNQMRGAIGLCINARTLNNSVLIVFTLDIALMMGSSLVHLVSWISRQRKPFLILLDPPRLKAPDTILALSSDNMIVEGILMP